MRSVSSWIVATPSIGFGMASSPFKGRSPPPERKVARTVSNVLQRSIPPCASKTRSRSSLMRPAIVSVFSSRVYSGCSPALCVSLMFAAVREARAGRPAAERRLYPPCSTGRDGLAPHCPHRQVVFGCRDLRPASQKLPRFRGSWERGIAESGPETESFGPMPGSGSRLSLSPSLAVPIRLRCAPAGRILEVRVPFARLTSLGLRGSLRQGREPGVARRSRREGPGGARSGDRRRRGRRDPGGTVHRPGVDATLHQRPRSCDGWRSHDPRLGRRAREYGIPAVICVLDA